MPEYGSSTVCEICGENHPTEAHPKNNEIHLASAEELETMSWVDMKALFDENDHILLSQLESQPIPYFGLHGAAQPALEYHKGFAKSGTLRFDTTTFPNKNINKRTLLNTLYSCARFANNYAFTSLSLRKNVGGHFQIPPEKFHEGGITVVNLEEVYYNKDDTEIESEYPEPPDHFVRSRGTIDLAPETTTSIVKVLLNADLAGYPEIFSKLQNTVDYEFATNGLSERCQVLNTKSRLMLGLLNQKVVEESLRALGVLK
jgi:hypothetical protein